VIEMDYEEFNGDRGMYCLEPYHLLAYHGNWYLLARNIRNDRVVTFALFRVKGIHASQRVFERPGRFDARAWFREAFGITRGDKILKVRLRFSRHVATCIKEREWHPSQQLRALVTSCTLKTPSAFKICTILSP
jgi:predicted DNA-binding transcriptional regulator YafY